MEIQKIILQKALKCIQLRPYSEGELRKKLSAFFPEELHAIEEVMAELKRVRLLNDENVAELFVNHWIQKRVGKRRIKMEAHKKQLDETLVEELLAESIWNEAESAQKALEIKLRTLKEEDPYKRKQKLMRFLQSRGFGQELIFKVLGSDDSSLL